MVSNIRSGRIRILLRAFNFVIYEQSTFKSRCKLYKKVLKRNNSHRDETMIHNAPSLSFRFLLDEQVTRHVYFYKVECRSRTFMSCY